MLAQGLVVGVGDGCLFLPSVAIVSQYFTTKRALATGVAAAGSGLGTSKVGRNRVYDFHQRSMS